MTLKPNIRFPYMTPKAAAVAMFAELEREFGTQISGATAPRGNEQNRFWVSTHAGFSFTIEAKLVVADPALAAFVSGQKLKAVIEVTPSVPSITSTHANLEDLVAHTMAAMTLLNIAQAARAKWERMVLPFVNEEMIGNDLPGLAPDFEEKINGKVKALIVKYGIDKAPYTDVLRAKLFFLVAHCCIRDMRRLNLKFFNPHLASSRQLEAAGLIEWENSNPAFASYVINPDVAVFIASEEAQ